METNEIVIVGVLYIVSLMLFLFYLYEKYRTEGYIFSICNAYIFQYAVILFLITPFAFTPKAWINYWEIPHICTHPTIIHTY